MPAVCVYVAFLQRHTKAPNLGHVRSANRLLLWIRKNLTRLGVRYRRLQEPLRLIALSDSAFKAQDYDGLVMRGCVIMLAEAVTDEDYPHRSACRANARVEADKPSSGGTVHLKPPRYPHIFLSMLPARYLLVTGDTCLLLAIVHPLPATLPAMLAALLLGLLYSFTLGTRKNRATLL